MAEENGARAPILLTGGPTAGRWVAFALLSGVWVLGGSFVTLLSLSMIITGDGTVSGVLLLVGTLVVWYLVVSAVLDLLRGHYWLDGTVLVQQRIRRHRRCDLATASIRADAAGGTPRLIAAEPGARPVILPLRDPNRGNRLLAAGHLRALADIISLHHEGEEVADIVAGLRRMAADPFDLLG